MTAVKVLLILLLCLGLAVLTVKYITPLSRYLVTEEGREALCRKVESYGAFAPLVYIAFMVFQIIIAFIPGGPLELVGGMLFGALWGTVYTVLGVLIGTLTVCLLVRLFGRPLVHFFVPEEKVQKFRILQDEKRLEFWVFILFLIPGIPKDLLTYIVPLTKLHWLHFVLLATLARLPSLVGSVLVGDSLTDGRYWLCIVICAVGAAAIFAGYQLKDRILAAHSGHTEENPNQKEHHHS